MRKSNAKIVRGKKVLPRTRMPKTKRLIVAVEIFAEDEEAFRSVISAFCPDPTVWEPDDDEWLDAMDPSHTED